MKTYIFVTLCTIFLLENTECRDLSMGDHIKSLSRNTVAEPIINGVEGKKPVGDVIRDMHTMIKRTPVKEHLSSFSKNLEDMLSRLIPNRKFVQDLMGLPEPEVSQETSKEVQALHQSLSHKRPRPLSPAIERHTKSSKLPIAFERYQKPSILPPSPHNSISQPNETPYKITEGNEYLSPKEQERINQMMYKFGEDLGKAIRAQYEERLEAQQRQAPVTAKKEAHAVPQPPLATHSWPQLAKKEAHSEPQTSLATHSWPQLVKKEAHSLPQPPLASHSWPQLSRKESHLLHQPPLNAQSWSQPGRKEPHSLPQPAWPQSTYHQPKSIAAIPPKQEPKLINRITEAGQQWLQALKSEHFKPVVDTPKEKPRVSLTPKEPSFFDKIAQFGQNWAQPDPVARPQTPHRFHQHLVQQQQPTKPLMSRHDEETPTVMKMYRVLDDWMQPNGNNID